jgi:hypothetical protein
MCVETSWKCEGTQRYENSDIREDAESGENLTGDLKGKHGCPTDNRGFSRGGFRGRSIAD